MIGGIAIGFQSAIPALLIIAVAVLAGVPARGHVRRGPSLPWACSERSESRSASTPTARSPTNAGGIAEMAQPAARGSRAHGTRSTRPETRTAAIAKGFRHRLRSPHGHSRSSWLTAPALAGLDWTLSVNILNPVVLVGLFIGGVSSRFMFSADTMNAVGACGRCGHPRGAAPVSARSPGLKEGKPEAKADYAKCVGHHDGQLAQGDDQARRPRRGHSDCGSGLPARSPNALAGPACGFARGGASRSRSCSPTRAALGDNAKKHIEKSGGKGTDRHKSRGGRRHGGRSLQGTPRVPRSTSS